MKFVALAGSPRRRSTPRLGTMTALPTLRRTVSPAKTVLTIKSDAQTPEIVTEPEPAALAETLELTYSMSFLLATLTLEVHAAQVGPLVQQRHGLVAVDIDQ